MKHLISVIIPVYKVEKYLDKCVTSIVNQSYRDLEIILVDDGSPDCCPEICDNWAQKDNRIRVVHKKNGGLSDARNKGIAVANGEMVGFVDGDDWIEEKFFECLYQAMIKADADIAECGTIYETEDGKVLRARKEIMATVLERKEALRHLVLEDGVYQTIWNKLYKAETIRNIAFEQGKCNEDDFWTYRVFDRGKKIAIVETPLYHYIQRGNSIIGIGYNAQRLDGLEAHFQRMEYLQKYDGLDKLTCQQFMFDCMWHLQCALCYLKGQEQRTAIKSILSLKERTKKLKKKELTLNWKYKIWYSMFNHVPVVTARIRNRLKIGL